MSKQLVRVGIQTNWGSLSEICFILQFVYRIYTWGTKRHPPPQWENAEKFINCIWTSGKRKRMKISRLFMKLSFIHPFRFRGDNARVFQQISMNLDMTVGQAACQLLCRYTQYTLAASCVCWIVLIVTCESG